MEATEQKMTWSEANQVCLAAEFSLLKGRFGSEGKGDAAARREEVRAGMESPPAIDGISALFGLSAFERQLVLLCAAVEMDSALAALCGKAQGNPQRAYATFGMAMAVLPEPHWSALTPARPLRRLQLIEVETGHGLTAAPLRIDERILHCLAGINILDTRLQSMLRPGAVPGRIAGAHESAAGEAARFLVAQTSRSPIIHFCGDDPEGQEDAATMAARQVGLQLYIAAAEDLPAAGPDLERFIVLWEREAAMLQAALLIQIGGGEWTASARRLAERLPGIVFLAGREPICVNRPFLRLDIDKPQPIEQRRLWADTLGPGAADFNGALDELSEQFRLSARTISATGSLMAGQEGGPQPAEVWAACRVFSRPRLDRLAQRIIPCAQWDDLVLPPLQKEMLLQLAAQVRHRMKVYETWGFSAKGQRGLGVSALFAGDNGTGKTMAAEVLAGDLGLDLYRIDLSAVVSKYIGETEKNLKQVFDAAEEGGVLLLFDEADALFGKRSDVKDSHDRYANIEVSYLLQRMEAYQGLAVLTSNLKGSLDRAFQRRLRFTVNFPFPDAAQREAIWSRIFPAKTPKRDLDYKRLSQLNVTGGNIRNIALNAAFLAAQAGRPVEMTNLVEASRLEAQKMERPLSDSEIRGWV
jgi:ATPase family associated with various cellular activities (AAA)